MGFSLSLRERERVPKAVIGAGSTAGSWSPFTFTSGGARAAFRGCGKNSAMSQL